MRAHARPLRPIDEADLDWYFGPGQTLHERSTFGPMLETAELYHVPLLPDPEIVAARRARIADGRFDEPEPGALTARPRGASHGSSGHTPLEGYLQRYARVSRRMQQVAAVNARDAAILAAYHGDRGARWGRTAHGRLVAVYALTPAGIELLRRSRKRPGWVDVGLSADEQIGVELEVNRTQPAAWRGTLLERARREALSAYTEACEQYLAATARLSA